MAQIRRNKKFTQSKLSYLPKEIYNFFFLAFTLLFALSIISHDPSDPNFFKTGLGDTINNYIGIFGSYISHITFMIFGKTSYFITALLIYLAFQKYRILITNETSVSFKNISLVIILLTSMSTVSEYILSSTGGLLGHIIFYHLSNYIGAYGALLASVMSFVYSFIFYFDISVSNTFNKIMKISTYIYLKTKYKLGNLYEQINLKVQLAKQKKTNLNIKVEKKSNLTQVEIVKPKPVESKRAFKEKQQILFSDSNNKLPLLEFLEQHDSEIINHDEDSLKLMSEMLEQNLSHYGISAKVKAVKPGPIVTLFEIEPVAGTKAATIIQLVKT